MDAVIFLHRYQKQKFYGRHILKLCSSFHQSGVLIFTDFLYATPSMALRKHMHIPHNLNKTKTIIFKQSEEGDAKHILQVLCIYLSIEPCKYSDEAFEGPGSHNQIGFQNNCINGHEQQIYLHLLVWMSIAFGRRAPSGLVPEPWAGISSPTKPASQSWGCRLGSSAGAVDFISQRVSLLSIRCGVEDGCLKGNMWVSFQEE